MPYDVGKHSSCPVSKPFAVLKSGGSLVPGGCHATKKEAIDHMVALKMNVERKERSEVVGELAEDSKPKRHYRDYKTTPPPI